MRTDRIVCRNGGCFSSTILVVVRPNKKKMEARGGSVRRETTAAHEKLLRRARSEYLDLKKARRESLSASFRVCPHSLHV